MIAPRLWQGTMRAGMSSSPDAQAILSAVGGLLGREIAIDDFLRRLVDEIREAMQADRGTIYLVDRAKGEVFSKVADLPPELGEIRLKLGLKRINLACSLAQKRDVLVQPFDQPVAAGLGLLGSLARLKEGLKRHYPSAFALV